MKGLINILLLIAGISLIMGIISRLTLLPLGPMELEGAAFMQFTHTCLLAAIAIGVLELVNAKG